MMGIGGRFNAISMNDGMSVPEKQRGSNTIQKGRWRTSTSDPASTWLEIVRNSRDPNDVGHGTVIGICG
jgi:hypothetical protein